MIFKGFKIKGKLYLGFGMLIILIIIVLGYTYMSLTKVSQVVDINLSTYEVMRESQGIFAGIANIETGSRDYIITGDKNYLGPYNDGKFQFQLHYGALKILFAKNQEKQQQLEDILKKYEIWMDFQSNIIMKKEIETLKDNDSEIIKFPNNSVGARELLQSEKYKQLIDDLQGILKQVNNDEENLLAIRSANLKDTKARVYITIVLSGVIVTILAMLTSFFTAVNITNPIKMLIAATENITKQNYQQPINFKADRDLEILIKNFNLMQKAVQSREEELNKKNEEIKIKMLEANEANRLKIQFLANVSHELRTPLNSIIGFTTRVIKKVGDILPVGQLENLKIVNMQSHHLLELINNILDYSKIEAGKMEVKIQNIILKDIIEEVNNIVKPLVEIKNLKYECEFDLGENTLISSDRAKIKHILINILGNSIKYSEEGCIKLSVFISDKNYCIKVEDQGIGIAAENIDIIFDEFTQVDGSYTRKVGGTGLGLAITKNFVELIGGRIEAESTLGSGSCFTIYLPMEISSEKTI